MASRNDRYIETGRAQLFVGVTVHEQPGEGSLTLSGAAGSVDSILIGGVTELLVAPIPFNTTLNQTAINVADSINNNLTAPNYHARAFGAKVFVWQQTIVGGVITLATITTTLVSVDVDISGGVIGNGTPVGSTVEGFEYTTNDEFLEEPTEESGVENVKSFYLSQNLSIQATFKQWDADVLALRFPGRHVDTVGENRIEFPGTIKPGQDMDAFYQVMELRPTNLKYPTLLIRRGLVQGNAGEPTRFRTQETKKIGVTLKCYRDENHVATDYKTAGIALAQNLVL